MHINRCGCCPTGDTALSLEDAAPPLEDTAPPLEDVTPPLDDAATPLETADVLVSKGSRLAVPIPTRPPVHIPIPPAI